MLDIELVYVRTSEEIIHIQLSVEELSTVGEALEASGLIQLYPEIKNLALGIFSRPASWTTPLKTGDRVEIYHPLLCDPKEKRRQRAKA